ncbi:thiol:disulfide interchange protein [Alteromonas aestuariivivens]|uniref:Thiol:disulfide interchange protein n=1 Tax=Alteromonas aestuariivivens TaxID=1938339 RepID=A0A3D8M493_9ALTE|nr:redoxin family protein [Alteromonas aestuariivivens]RDV24365.1 thiol:disulfide interchange protein [Alteromonas aestuariivivens]
MKKMPLVIIPLVLFALLVVFLFQGLFSDPRALDSQVVGKPLPHFELPDLMQPQTIYTPEVFKGDVTIVNVWGVWCVTCAVELPYLTQLSQQGVKFVGLYFDQDLDPDFGTKTLDRVQTEVTQMLGRYGNPYSFNIFDVYRDTSLDLGVTGAPEHFVIDKQGIVRMHHIGDINERVWASKVGPLYDQLQAQTFSSLKASQAGGEGE